MSGFEEVRTQFERNFVERGEIGAAVAAYWRGVKVVDLWGGRRTPEGDAPWNEDTMVIVMSTTKGLAAMTLAVANARGWLDYDASIAHYWPEFAQNGKAAITVRQLLAHEAGLVLLDESLSVERLRELDELAHLLARQKPSWTPGTRHGYHAMTIGLYMQELIRRVDPAHRSLGRDALPAAGPTQAFGSSPRAFGMSGAGGSLGFADPDARLGYAYVMNKLDFYLQDDPREKALRDAVYRSMARVRGG